MSNRKQIRLALTNYHDVPGALCGSRHVTLGRDGSRRLGMGAARDRAVS
ncbi:MAG TPA: hypothetical protein VHC22_05790 [Pirellulales bacterium]|nr:hypothetical protein [Pirellulales bacterium]